VAFPQKDLGTNSVFNYTLPLYTISDVNILHCTWFSLSDMCVQEMFLCDNDGCLSAALVTGERQVGSKTSVNPIRNP